MSELVQPASVIEALIAKLLNGGQHWLRLQHGAQGGWFAALGDRSATGSSLFTAMLNLAAVPEGDPGDGPGPDDGEEEDDGIHDVTDLVSLEGTSGAAS